MISPPFVISILDLRVFVSFGCHPKARLKINLLWQIPVDLLEAAWFYNDDFEATLLSHIKACGSRPRLPHPMQCHLRVVNTSRGEKVVGFGEFGLEPRLHKGVRCWHT